jgi:hypothetical protein
MKNEMNISFHGVCDGNYASISINPGKGKVAVLMRYHPTLSRNANIARAIQYQAQLNGDDGITIIRNMFVAI